VTGRSSRIPHAAGARSLAAPYRQHGKRGRAHHALGDTADEKLREAGPAVRPHHDHVGARRLWSPNDLLRWVSLEQQAARAHTGFPRLGDQLVNLLLTVRPRRTLEVDIHPRGGDIIVADDWSYGRKHVDEQELGPIELGELNGLHKGSG